MKEFKFKVGVAPTQDTINRCNKCAAEILVNKYGVDVIKKALELLEMQKTSN